MLISTLLILTTWLVASFSNVGLPGYPPDPELSTSSGFLSGLKLGNGVLPARRAFNCRVSGIPLGLVSEDAALSIMSRLFESMTGIECVVISDIEKTKIV